MKLLILSALFLSFSSFAKEDLNSFQKELLTEVNTEISKDDYRLKTRATGRGPASVEESHHPKFESVPKIDKSVRQTGHTDW